VENRFYIDVAIFYYGEVLLENPLCKLLGIRYPIRAGMAGQTTPELVAAVSNAGGLGVLGVTRMTPEKLLDAIRKTKMITTKPYGVNLWLGPRERKKNDVQDILSVQRFLDQKFRKPLGIPLKSESPSENGTKNNNQSTKVFQDYQKDFPSIRDEKNA
jgi:NAD(P)H-dependent flavin oxidoreductase YrpB (nitropropane dioxygenase family)